MSISTHMTGRIAPNSMLNGRYLIIRPVGRGGMGAVYEATDTASHPNLRVAVKEMSQSKLSHEELEKAKKRFRGEAAMLSSLNHPNLPRVYDSFEENGRSYLVMDFIEGQTLFQMLQDSYPHPLPLEQVLNYACQLCDVLDYLHRQYPPIIFRDLKPSNIMISSDGQLFLVDFGIARFFKTGQAHDTEAFGSFAYASPQHMRGEQTNVRSDIYSLGATLHHCLTGKVPTYAYNNNQFPSIRQFNPSVPEAVDKLVLSMVEEKESKRPKSAEDVKQELVKIVKQSEELTGQFKQVGSYALPPTMPVAQQQPLKLPGDATSHNDKTFSVNQQPDDTEPWPDWIIDLGKSYKSFVVWWSLTLFPLILILFGRLLKASRTSLSSIGRLITSRKLPKVSGTQVRRSFAQIGQGIAAGYENARLGVSNWSSQVFTPGFVGLLLLRLALFIVASIVLFRAFHGSYSIVAFCLAVFLLIISGSASISARIHDPLARSILFGTAFSTLIAGLALQATPDVQDAFKAITLSQLLSVVLIFSAFIALIRTSNRFTWVDNVSMVLIAATCALLQFTLGRQDLQDHSIVAPSSDLSPLIAIGLTIVLAVIAFIFLCRLTSAFSKMERFLVLVVAVIYAFLQFASGEQELQHIPFFTATMSSSTSGLLNVAYVYILLVGIPLVAAVAALLFGHRFALLDRLAIFVLAVACALLQSALANDVQIPSSASPYPLLLKVVDIFTLNQIFTYGALLVGGLLLLVRLVRPNAWLERPAIFAVAIVCSLLQSAFWTDTINEQLAFTQASGIALNQMIAGSFLLLVVCGIAIPVATALIHLARQNAWINRRASGIEKYFTWIPALLKIIDRLAILGITLITTSLMWFFGDQGPLLSYSFPIESAAVTVTVHQLATIVLLVLAIVAFFRIGKPFNRWTCITLLIDAIACMLLAYGNPSTQKVSPPVFSSMQAFMGQLLQGNMPNLLLFVGLVACAAISLLWLRRTPPRPRADHVLLFVLSVLFVGAIICTLLHYVWPVLLLVALLMLIHGIFVAVQMERVR